MSVVITFDGNNYTIPTSGDEYWPELSDYFVALSKAATQTSMKYNVRINTTAGTIGSPASILTTDTIILQNIAAPSYIALPGGVAGQFYGIYDYSGAGLTYPITISASLGQLINGQSTYKIQSPYGGILVQFNGTSWQIINELSFNVILSTIYRQNNQTNKSLIEDGVIATEGFPSVVNLQSCSFALTSTYYQQFYISVSNGKGFLCSTSYNSNKISALSDINDMFLITDAGTGIYVYKSATSATINIKNRLGVTVSIEIHTTTGQITSPVAWA